MPRFSKKNKKSTTEENQPSNTESTRVFVNDEGSQDEMQYMLDRIAELERKQNELDHKFHHHYRDAVIRSQEISLVDKLCTNDPYGHECITYLGKVCNEYPEIPQCVKDFYN